MAEQAAKGHTLHDGTYVFTCGHCGGSGHYGTEDCSWCYGLDTARISAAMQEGARGGRYYGLLKALLSVQGKAMVDEFKRLKADAGKVTPIDIAYIALKFKLNYKATWEWLCETRCIRTDYDDIPHAFKVSEAFTAARQKYPELTQAPAPSDAQEG